MRFDPAKVLLDPYGRGVVVPQNYSREAARQPGNNCATAMKSLNEKNHNINAFEVGSIYQKSEKIFFGRLSALDWSAIC